MLLENVDLKTYRTGKVDVKLGGGYSHSPELVAIMGPSGCGSPAHALVGRDGAGYKRTGIDRW